MEWSLLATVGPLLVGVLLIVWVLWKDWCSGHARWLGNNAANLHWNAAATFSSGDRGRRTKSCRRVFAIAMP